MKELIEKRLLESIKKLSDKEILCLFGLHLWSYMNYAPPHQSERKCKNCYKMELAPIPDRK